MAEKKSEKKPAAPKKAAKPKAKATEKKADKVEAVKAESPKKKVAETKVKADAKPKKKAASEITVTLIKSGIGKAKDQKATIRGLGFKRLNQTVTLKDTPAIRGMINKISHLVEIQ